MRPRFRLRPLVAVLVLAVAVASCAGNDDDADTAASTSEVNAVFHDISDDPVVVSGTATCDFSPTAGVGAEGGSGWLVTCELDLSDPKVSGTETHDRIRIVSGGAVGDVWVAEEAFITNAEGTWRGIAQAADDGRPSGEAHYFGEGAYEGLEFHYYFGQFPEEYDDETTALRGWISDTG